MQMQMLTDLNVGSSPPTSTLAKRPRARPLVLTINEDGDVMDVQDNIPKPKKLKKTASQPAVMVLQHKALIIKIVTSL
jgi:hypothetical protein